MKEDNKSLGQKNSWQKAEELLVEIKAKKKHLGFPKTTKKLIHELEVHQIELKMQNEELVQARFEAQKASNKYEELYDFAPSMYLTLSRDGIIKELNFNAARILRKERANLINIRFGIYVSLATRPVFEQFLNKAFNSNAKETCVLVLEVNDSSIKNVHLSGIVKEDSEQCLVIMIDTTESIQSAKELRESESRYHSLFENSPIPLWEMDYSRIFRKLADLKNTGTFDIAKYLTDNPQKLIRYALLIKVLDVNKEAIKLFKAESREILMKSYMEIFTELTVPVFIDSLKSIMEGKNIFESEVILQTLQKERLVCLSKWSGEGTQVIISTQNITARKQAEKELDNYRENLESTIEARTKELGDRNTELQNFNRVFVGREFRIKELRDKVKELEEKLGIVR
ncbi:MAG: hypothetical protein RAO94_04030 [Candidatus Stygibacter australis]|nr:hypothetical protein [Candidatus Stygibacter australis]